MIIKLLIKIDRALEVLKKLKNDILIPKQLKKFEEKEVDFH